MSARIIDVDPVTGIAMTFRYDAERDETIIGYHQDATPIIEHNKRLAIEREQSLKGDYLAHYACVPTIVQYEWLFRHGVNFGKRDHWPEVMKLLNSPDYKYLKTTTRIHDR